MEEIWKKIKGHPRYEISNKGEVRNTKTGRILKHGKNQCGYHHVILDYKTITVHKLVAQHFLINKYPEINRDIDHIDGNKNNNCADNLRYCTHLENMNKRFLNPSSMYRKYINRIVNEILNTEDKLFIRKIYDLVSDKYAEYKITS